MTTLQRDISLRIPHGVLHGHLWLPEFASTLILLPRTGHHPAHIAVQSCLHAQYCAVLDMELLSSREVQFADNIENVYLLAERLLDILDTIRNDADMENLALGIFAADQIAPAALRAAAQRDRNVGAIVTLGGILDRAGREYLEALAAPLLTLIDLDDTVTAEANRRASALIHAKHELRLIEAHEVAEAASAWFKRWLTD